MINRELVLKFRRKITAALEANENKDEPYNKGVAAVCRALLTDYDNMFQPDILAMEAEALQPLIDKYCHKRGCPICGNNMKPEEINKDSAKCIKCGGRRHFRRDPLRERNAWKVTPNDALRFYLTECDRQDKLTEQNHRGSRFRQLDLE